MSNKIVIEKAEVDAIIDVTILGMSNKIQIEDDLRKNKDSSHKNKEEPRKQTYTFDMNEKKNTNKETPT
jgi:hypothetical protein